MADRGTPDGDEVVLPRGARWALLAPAPVVRRLAAPYSDPARPWLRPQPRAVRVSCSHAVGDCHTDL